MNPHKSFQTKHSQNKYCVTHNSTYLSTGRRVPVPFLLMKYSLSAFLLICSTMLVARVSAYKTKLNARMCK